MEKYIEIMHREKVSIDLSSSMLLDTGIIDKSVTDLLKVISKSINGKSMDKSLPIETKINYLKIYELIKEKGYITVHYSLLAKELNEYLYRNGINPFNVNTVSIRGNLVHKNGKGNLYVELFFYDKNGGIFPFNSIYSEIEVELEYNKPSMDFDLVIVNKKEYNSWKYYTEVISLFEGGINEKIIK